MQLSIFLRAVLTCASGLALAIPGLAGALEVNDPLPAVSVHDEAGVATELSGLKGKVTYIDFWASWCPPCRESFPFMNQLVERYGKDGLNVVAISVDRDRALADKALKRLVPQFKVMFDPSGEAAKAFKLPTMPTSFVIDAEGRVRSVKRGFRDGEKAELEKTISELLKS
jgi:thiol-disulfide isomerase/thioredoxin